MVRLLTYNVHRCVGTDRRLDVGRVAEVIAAQSPDIVALQEVDVGRARTGGVDQAHRLAQRLGMAFHFNAALQVEEEQLRRRHPHRPARAPGQGRPAARPSAVSAAGAARRDLGGDRHVGRRAAA